MKRATAADFPPGTRVRLHTESPGFFNASLGMERIVVHLNAKPYLTGTVLHGAPGYITDMVMIRPDGWPLPNFMLPLGFFAYADKVENWPAGPESPCVITDAFGRPVTQAEVERLVSARAFREKNRPNSHERSP